MTWSGRAKRDAPGNPIVALQKAVEPSKKYTEFVRPDFVIVSWDSGERDIADVPNIPPPAALDIRDDMEDEIPF